MGSVVEYRCAACTFSSGHLSVGWGRGGRATYWGGLALCEGCKQLSVVDLADTRVDRRDHKCAECAGLLKLLEGIASAVSCPRCTSPLRHAAVGSWT